MPLDPSIIISVIQLLGTVAGAAFAVKLQVARLADGQGRLSDGLAETLRQLGALHKRMDHYGAEVARIDKDAARLDERIKGLQESQRFRMVAKRAVAEAREAGETPMFIVEGDQG